MPCPFSGLKMFCAGPNFFVPDQKFIYILWQSQRFCAQQKDYLHSVKLVFMPAQIFLDAVKFLGCLKNFWTAQKNLGPVKLAYSFMWKSGRVKSCLNQKSCLTLFLSAMGGISPYMSVTWPSPVGIGLNRKTTISTYFGSANNDKYTANQVDSQQYDTDDKEIKHDIGQICNFFIVFWW